MLFNLLDNIVGLLQRNDDRTFGRIHRVQRLDTKNDAGLLRIGKHFHQAIQHSGARILKRLPVGWAGDDDQHRRAQDGSFLNGDAVIRDAFAPLFRSRRREPSSTTEAGDAQAFIANHRGSFLDVAVKFMSPHCDVWNPAVGAVAHHLLQRPGIGSDLIEAETF